jgi:DNA (cytosine-5)-methyltransferase 1
MQIEPLDFCEKNIPIVAGSPPCPSFSLANIGGGETVRDVALSNRMSYFIKKIRPRAMLFENVAEYQHSTSYIELMESIENAGYTVDAAVYNAADFGVAQTRKRVFIRAVRGARSKLFPVQQTRCKKGDVLPRWTGWYEALGNQMISDLPEDKLNPSQQAVLTGETCMIQRLGYYKKPKIWTFYEPIGTIRASLGCDGKKPKNSPDNHRGYDRPYFLTIWEQGNLPFHGKNCTTEALARLQGWPDGVSFTGKSSIDVHVIGNSVVPVVAKALIQSMRF